MEEALRQQPSDCVKIVIFGPESTGKTTISRQLAEHYNTLWVPEYARDYLQYKWDTKKEICSYDDLLPIAKGQITLENENATKANRVLICDTDILETKVYSETYFNNQTHPLLNKYAIENTYDLYFLTYIDVPWVADDLRDKPNQRKEMFNAFETALKTYNKPYVLLKGDKETRFKIATHYIDKILNKHEL